jgi:hypothetical protein
MRNFSSTTDLGIFFSADTIDETDHPDHARAVPEYLAQLTHPGIPPHELHLKRGCICSVMRNMSVRNGLVKNARVVVQEIHHCFVEV